MPTGIPVPDYIPEGSKGFTVCVPDSPFFMGVVMGLLKQGTFKYFWSGTDEQKTAASERMMQMYLDYQEQVNCMDCDAVADCIATSDAVRDALEARLIELIESSAGVQEAIARNVSNPGNGTKAADEQFNENMGTGECDNNAFFGGVTALVDNMNGNNTDFLQQIAQEEQVTNKLKIYISAIPGLNELPLDEAFDFFGTVMTGILTNYEAEYDSQYRDELRCGLFCVGKDLCTLSMDDVWNFFTARVGASASDNFQNIIHYLIEGTWEGTEICDIMFLTQLAAIKFFQEFNAFSPGLGKVLGVQNVSLMFREGLNNPDSDWELLCEDCPTEIEIGLWNYPQGFGGSLQSTIGVELDTPFNVAAFQRGASSVYELSLSLPENYVVHWGVVSGTLGATNTGEISWLYKDSSGTDHFGVSPTEIASDMPEDVECHATSTGSSWYMNSGSGAYTLNLTISLP